MLAGAYLLAKDDIRGGVSAAPALAIAHFSSDPPVLPPFLLPSADAFIGDMVLLPDIALPFLGVPAVGDCGTGDPAGEFKLDLPDDLEPDRLR